MNIEKKIDDLFKKKIYVILLFVLSLGIILIRKPDAILNPQFWAEDGRLWYAQAYTDGWFNAFFIPITGYYQTLSRIGGGLAQFFPLLYAPLIFNLIATLLLASPVLILMSSGAKKIFPSIYVRLFIVIMYLTLPNASEIYINLTNAQWSLALVSLLALFFLKNTQYFLLKLSVFLVSGLSGPFSIMLFPVSFLYFKKSFDRKNIILFAAIGLTALIQIITLLTANNRDSNFPSETSLQLLLAIFAKQIVWGSLVGINGYTWIIEKIPFYNLFLILTSIFALILIIYCLVKAELEIKLMLLFATGIFFSSLIFPVIGDTLTISSWQYLLAESGTRYWFIPMIIFLISLVWVFSNKRTYFPMRVIAFFFLSSMVLFQLKNYRHYHNFRYKPYADLHFYEYANEFKDLDSGSEIVVPVNPPVDKWQMHLTKH